MGRDMAKSNLKEKKSRAGLKVVDNNEIKTTAYTTDCSTNI